MASSLSLASGGRPSRLPHPWPALARHGTRSRIRPGASIGSAAASRTCVGWGAGNRALFSLAFPVPPRGVGYSAHNHTFLPFALDCGRQGRDVPFGLIGSPNFR